MSEIKLDYSKIHDVDVEDVDTGDYPDFCDAYIESAYYGDRLMTEQELQVLNDDGDFVLEAVWDHLF